MHQNKEISVYTSMQKEYGFVVWNEVEPRVGLYALVLSRLAEARLKAARIRALLLSALALAFGAALVPAAEYASRELYASGFYEYASLLFSDRGFVFSSSREFALSLIESLPSLAVLLITLASAGLLWSLARAIPHAKVAFRRSAQGAF